VSAAPSAGCRERRQPGLRICAETRRDSLLRVPPGPAARCAPCVARISSSSLIWMASVSRFCVFWIRKTIRNVTIVVPVLITTATYR
jgi:hypothetical protein